MTLLMHGYLQNIANSSGKRAQYAPCIMPPPPPGILPLDGAWSPVDRPLLHNVSAQSTNQLHVSVIKDVHWPESDFAQPS